MTTIAAVDLRRAGRWRARRLLRELYHEVLVPSFDPAELRPWPELRSDVLGRGATSLAWVAFDADGILVGGCVADWDPERRIALGAYLAMRPGRRGEGHGTAIVESLAADVLTELDPLLLLGEAEDPRLHGSSATGDPVARLRLYDRLGVRLLALPYVLPKVSPEAPRRPGYLLTVYHVAPEFGDEVPTAVLEPYLRRYFTECEGAAVLDDDPEVAALFDHLATVPSIPVVSILDYAAAVPGR